MEKTLCIAPFVSDGHDAIHDMTSGIEEGEYSSPLIACTQQELRDAASRISKKFDIWSSADIFSLLSK